MAQDDSEPTIRSVCNSEHARRPGKTITYERLIELIAEARTEWRRRNGIEPEAYTGPDVQ